MMMMNQSFLRNLLVLFALCVLLIEAAPIKVRRREPGSSQDEIPRLPKRVVKQPFAPYREYKKRQAQASSSSASAAASSSTVSVSVRTRTITSTRTQTVSFTTTATQATVPSNLAGDLSAALGAAIGAAGAPPDLASFLSAALGQAISTSSAQPTTTAAAVPAVPPEIASQIASGLSVALGGASVPPALASQFSVALGSALAAATGTPSVSASSASATQAAGTTVTVAVNKLPTPVSSVSSVSATGTTVTFSVNNLPTPVVPSKATSALPSVSMAPATAAKCQETNIFNKAELHANPRKNIVLFKALPNDQATIANLVSNPTPPRNEQGDFSNTGAFYLTDTWQAAAQAACYGSGQPRDSVAVIQYKWNPKPDTKVLEFRSANTQWNAFIKTKNDPFVLNNDIIAGPSNFRKDITTAFWQYAINSDKGMANLDLAAIYQPVFCKDIPRGNCLPLGQ